MLVSGRGGSVAPLLMFHPCPSGGFLERAGLAAGALEKGPGLYGVPLLAVSFSPSDARHASPLNAVQFLKTAGRKTWNLIVVHQPPHGELRLPLGACSSFFRRANWTRSFGKASCTSWMKPARLKFSEGWMIRESFSIEGFRTPRSETTPEGSFGFWNRSWYLGSRIASNQAERVVCRPFQPEQRCA